MKGNSTTSSGYLPFINWLVSQLIDRTDELVAIVYMQWIECDLSILQCNVWLAVVQRHLIQDEMARQSTKIGAPARGGDSN